MIYDRQDSLELAIPHSALVIGCGGIGSWVALDLALAGVNKLYLIDFDIIEEHNLNRTPFRTIDIGRQKINVVTELILERRTIEIIPISQRIEDIDETTFNKLKEVDVVIDCRDTTQKLPDALGIKQQIICGYDGLNVSIHINPYIDKKLWGESGPIEYRTIPSFVAPPQLLASLITMYICSTKKIVTEEIITLEMDEIIKRLI